MGRIKSYFNEIRCNDFMKILACAIIIGLMISLMGDFSRVLIISMSSIMFYFIYSVTYFVFTDNKMI